MKREGRPVPPELRELSQAADVCLALAANVVRTQGTAKQSGAVNALRKALDNYDAAKARLEDE